MDEGLSGSDILVFLTMGTIVGAAAGALFEGLVYDEWLRGLGTGAVAGFSVAAVISVIAARTK